MRAIIDTQDIPLFRQTIQKWGIGLQVTKGIEECAELIYALCQAQQGQTSRENLADEIADVRIMLSQIIVAFNLEEAVDKRIEYKLKRLEVMLAHGIEALDKSSIL